jgi:hypothetical protein
MSQMLALAWALVVWAARILIVPNCTSREIAPIPRSLSAGRGGRCALPPAE